MGIKSASSAADIKNVGLFDGDLDGVIIVGFLKIKKYSQWTKWSTAHDILFDQKFKSKEHCFMWLAIRGNMPDLCNWFLIIYDEKLSWF